MTREKRKVRERPALSSKKQLVVEYIELQCFESNVRETERQDRQNERTIERDG